MLILIGQAPNQHGDERHALEGCLGDKLACLFGCQPDEYLRLTQRFNVLPGWMGKAGNGDRFPVGLARQNARRMRYSLGGCRVLFVGVATAAAFGVGPPILRWGQHRVAKDNSEAFRAAVLPHPSGINRWWNDRQHRRAAQRFMQRTWRHRED